MTTRTEASWLAPLVAGAWLALAGPGLAAAGPAKAAPVPPAAFGEDLPERAWRLPPPGIGLRECLLVSGTVFAIGLLVIVLRRNAVGVLMGIELVLNAAALNFVAFSSFVSRDRADGQALAVFVIAVAAAEASVALAIVVNIFRSLRTVKVDAARSLRG